ncbi:hypothetical protein GCM10009430_27040 [Aquimarina litoralis]|uniref:Uncharacterized protein n=1 Tax=Aquimarina litoralis TaxID=584605 RepID=A0ABN1IY67_9FLAO
MVFPAPRNPLNTVTGNFFEIFITIKTKIKYTCEIKVSNKNTNATMLLLMFSLLIIASNRINRLERIEKTLTKLKLFT